jgi:hypothetical protein
MRDLSFFVDAVTTGRILGVDAACTPEEVTDTLGEYAENIRDNVMWRDYGAIEFFWERTTSREPWEGTHLSVQIHRLSGYPEQMNAAVQQVYGEFREHLRFDELRTALANIDCDLVELSRHPPYDTREYVNPRPAVTIVVAVDDSHLGIDEGDVWSITCGNPIRRSGYRGPSVDDS